MTSETDYDSLTRAFIEATWSPTMTVRDWWAALASSGLAFPVWPVGLGGLEVNQSAANIIFSALGKAHVIGAPPGLGTLMGGPVVATFGTPEQQTRLLPPLATGIEGWCQLFSEPGAGSDLASVATRAERDGEEWVITGQKVWTSGAMHSRRGMLIARTDWDQAKHRGITYFIIDLEQPGVEIRPIKQMNGKAHFSEVFFDEARVSDADRISDINHGWEVASATLRFERSGLSAHGRGGIQVHPGAPAGNLDRMVGEIIGSTETTAAPEDEAAPGAFASLQHLARRKAGDDPIDDATRDRLVDIYARERIAGWSQARTRAASMMGRPPGPESSTSKLWWTEGLRRSAALGMELIGAQGMLAGPESEGGGAMQTFTLSIPSASIAGGSDEVQKNIIAERALGLPKDLSVDSDVAFKDVRRS
jgi:alkylation response protein AidB-like acyl-CoA dehydrogenase